MKALFDGTIGWWSWNIAFAWKPSVTSSRLDRAGTNRCKARVSLGIEGPMKRVVSLHIHRTSYWAWGCSIAILVYRRVESQGRLSGRDAFKAFQCFQALFGRKAFAKSKRNIQNLSFYTFSRCPPFMFSCVFCCPIEITEAEAPNGRIYNSLLFAGTVDLAHDLEASHQLGAMFGGAEYIRSLCLIRSAGFIQTFWRQQDMIECLLAWKCPSRESHALRWSWNSSIAWLDWSRTPFRKVRP